MPDGKREMCVLWQLPATDVRILQDFKEFDENKNKRETSATKNIKDGQLSSLFSISGFSLLRTAHTTVGPHRFPKECAFF
jgi:hypothetical protein